jgi:HPt (histidine-containing phosphotransfer) domain-containing protein
MNDHLDIEQIKEAKDILGDAFGQLVEGYIHDTQVILAEIDVARASHHNEKIKQQVHTLKSSSFQVGAKQVQSASEEIEAYLKKNSDHLNDMASQFDIDTKIIQLRQNFADYQDEIKKHL